MADSFDSPDGQTQCCHECLERDKRIKGFVELMDEILLALWSLDRCHEFGDLAKRLVAMKGKT